MYALMIGPPVRGKFVELSSSSWGSSDFIKANWYDDAKADMYNPSTPFDLVQKSAT